MPWGKKYGGRDFQKGHTYSKKLPEDVKQARKLRTEDLERIINKLLRMTRAELKERMEDPSTPMIEAFVGSVVMKGITDGDPVRLNHLMIWLLGKPDAAKKAVAQVPYYEIHKSDGTVVRMGVQAVERGKQNGDVVEEEWAREEQNETERFNEENLNENNS